MSGIQKYLKSFRQVDDLEVGLFEKNDGTQWIRNPDGSETAIGGGGEQPDEKEQPTADITGVVLDTTTYDNPITGGPDKLRCLVFPAAPAGDDQVAWAWAIEGDAFPRAIFLADPASGADFGDGTTDPWNDNSAGWDIQKNAGGTYKFVIIAGAASAVFGQDDANIGAGNYNRLHGVTRLGLAGFSGGPGAPTIGGNVGDIYIRTDGDGTIGQMLYQCTVAGGAGGAVWTGATA